MSGFNSIWAVSDGEKVKRDDVGNRLRGGNAVWDGSGISLHAARNEIVAFQVIVESGEGGIENLRTALPGMSAAQGKEIGYEPAAGDPSDFTGRGIEIFYENYLEVTEASNAFWVYRRESPSAPKDVLGWTPVQLVPENAPAARGGTGLSVPPRSNQAVWIDVYVPRDASAGLYEGAVTVTADGEKFNIPVRLAVFDFTLPDANSLLAMVYYEPGQVELYHGKNLDERYHRFAHRNRIELVHDYSRETALAAKGRFDGSAFSSASGYQGPGENSGNRIIPATFYGPREYAGKQQAVWKAADEWMEFLSENFPEAVTFVYMPDEPLPDKYPAIRRMADNIHSNPGPGGALPVLVTKEHVAELDGAVDIWCSGMWGYDIERARSERARGRKAWVYNGTRPFCGAASIDSPATDLRAIPWACFKHDVGVYFAWHSVHWEHNAQKQGERKQNVWKNPETFNNLGQPNKADQGTVLGDGVLMYPGQEKVHPEEDRGIEGPCSCLRLANLRRGLQDHLYLTMARELGLDAIVEESLQAVVPRVFSDVSENDPVGFAETGGEYEAARLKIGRAIAAALSNGADAR